MSDYAFTYLVTEPDGTVAKPLGDKPLTKGWGHVHDLLRLSEVGTTVTVTDPSGKSESWTRV